MKIGILVAGHVPDEMTEKHGDYDTIFSQLLRDDRFTFKTWNVVDGAFPKGLDEADGWLITGSKHGAYEPHSWIPPLETLIRQIDAAKKPMIGVCFGHQIIAQALGGRVEKFAGGWVAGENRYARRDLGKQQNILAWHQDQVVEKPPMAELLGSSPHCQFAVLRYGDHILTYQAHPEFTADFVHDLLAARPDLLPADVATHVEAADDATISRRELVEEMKAVYLK